MRSGSCGWETGFRGGEILPHFYANIEIAIVASIGFAVPAFAMAASPVQCVGWPKSVAETKLKNAGIIDPVKLDESKTHAVRIASQKIGKDLYRDVYNITFHEKSGRVIEVVTSGEASSSECSMGSVDVYVVSTRLADNQPVPAPRSRTGVRNFGFRAVPAVSTGLRVKGRRSS